MRKLIHLQMLRGVAASLVVAAHAMQGLINNGTFSNAYQGTAWLLGWLGVGTFFIISGLIMVRTTVDGGSINAALGFAFRRIIRIVPMYWLATIFTYAVGVRHHPEYGIINLIKSLLFIPYGTPAQAVLRPILGQGWTLNYEMFFYILFASCLLLPRRMIVRVLVLLLAALVALGCLYRPLIPYDDAHDVLSFYTDPLILLFAMGAVIGALELRHKTWHAAPAPMALSTAIFAGCIAAFIFSGAAFPLQIGWQLVFALACGGAVLASTTTADGQPGTVGRLLEKSGDASYSTYLFHTLILGVAIKAWHLAPAAMRSPWLFMLGVILAANLFGYVVHRLVEVRITSLLRRRGVGPADTRIATARVREV